MTCKYCCAVCVFQEHLPTEEHGFYRFACGSEITENMEEFRGSECKKKEKANWLSKQRTKRKG